MATASIPTRTEVGLSQLDQMSPAAFPTGTLPDAIPPIAAPSANGVSTEESANTPPDQKLLAPWRRGAAHRVGDAAHDDPERRDAAAARRASTRSS